MQNILAENVMHIRVGGPSSPESLPRKVLPNHPWQATAIDLIGPFPTGESQLHGGVRPSVGIS